MKKYIIIGLVIIILCVVGVSLLFNNDDAEIKQYVNEKYNLNVNVLSEFGGGFVGDLEYVVQDVDREQLVFTVYKDEHTGEIIQDDYKQGLRAYEAYLKIKGVLPEIEKLEFKAVEIGNAIVSYMPGNIEKSNSLYFETEQSIELETFKEQYLNKFYELYRLLKSTGAELSSVTVSDVGEPANRDFISFSFNDKTYESAESFYNYITEINLGLSSVYANQLWEDELLKIENERFRFKGDYGEFYFNCLKMDQSLNCVQALVPIYFKEGLLSRENPYLAEDMEKILNLFSNTIRPKMQVEYAFYEEGQDDSYRITDGEIASYGSVQSFIDANF